MATKILIPPQMTHLRREQFEERDLPFNFSYVFATFWLKLTFDFLLSLGEDYATVINVSYNDFPIDNVLNRKQFLIEFSR